MQEYPGFVYLDLKKTGSTFVIDFLREFAKDDALRSQKHARVDEHDPNKFYFITYRDPLEQYLSLYSYGCADKGQTQNLIRGMGRHEEFYDRSSRGFSAWLRFMLQPENSTLGFGLKPGIGEIIGFQTCRFLMMSLPTPKSLLAACRTKHDVLEALRSQRIWHEAIETAHLNDGLASLARGKLASHLQDVDAAVEYLANAKKVNRSRRVDRADGFEVAEGDKQLIEDREWLFFEVLGVKRYSAD